MTAARAQAKLIAVLCLLFLLSPSLRAQVNGVEVSGTVKDSSGAVVPDAAVTARNLATGGTATAQTNSAGTYSFSNLAPGAYEVSVSVNGQSKTAQANLAAGQQQTVDLDFSSGLSLQDLGFSAGQTRGNPQEQARLDKRSHMLKIHQRLGLITLAPMAATIITGAYAGGRRNPSSTDRDVHAALGSLTAGLYFTTASFAIFAPKIPGTETRGPIRLHKALAFIHGPGMILTPILGAMAFQQRSQGQRVHGIAQAHGAVAVVTGAAYGLAMLSVTLKKF